MILPETKMFVRALGEHYHAVIWIDHREAKVFHVKTTDVDRLVVHAHNPTWRFRRKGDVVGPGSAAVDHEFFRRVAECVQCARAILISGPGRAKSELAAHFVRHCPDIARRVAGVETIEHPGDGAMVAVARIYFKAYDPLHFGK